jgi:hypothetical protein
MSKNTSTSIHHITFFLNTVMMDKGGCMYARFRDHSTPEMARCRCSPIPSTRIPSTPSLPFEIDLSQPMD